MTLDPSQSMGWCHGVAGGPIKAGVYKVTGDRLTRKLLNIEAFLTNMIKGNGIGRVYCESPIIATLTSFDSVRSSVGVNTVIGMTCTRLGVDCYDVDQQTWRAGFMKWPNGKGITAAPKMSPEEIMAILVDMNDRRAVDAYKASSTEKRNKARATEARRRWLKARTMEECAKRGYPTDNDDEADAIGIWCMVTDRARRRAETPELDLLGGLDVS